MSSWRRKVRAFADVNGAPQSNIHSFSAQTRMSGVDMDGNEIRKGAP